MKMSKQKKHIIQLDLSGCKNMKECGKVIDMIISGRIKITVNEQSR